MNEDWKIVSEFFTDESKLVFKDGTIMEGAEEVGKHLLRCCEEYNKGYLEGKSKVALFYGAMVLGGAIGVVSVISARKLIKKLNSKKETQES